MTVSSRSQYFGSRNHSNLQQIHIWNIFLAVMPKSQTLYNILLKYHQKKINKQHNQFKISSSCSLCKITRLTNESYWTGSQKDQTVYLEWSKWQQVHEADHLGCLYTTVFCLIMVLPLPQRDCGIHSRHPLKKVMICWVFLINMSSSETKDYV